MPAHVRLPTAPTKLHIVRALTSNRDALSCRGREASHCDKGKKGIGSKSTF